MSCCWSAARTGTCRPTGHPPFSTQCPLLGQVSTALHLCNLDTTVWNSPQHELIIVMLHKSCFPDCTCKLKQCILHVNLSSSWCHHDATLPRLGCCIDERTITELRLHAGQPNFVFEKASLRGVISAQLAEAQGHKGSQALFCELADSLRSEDACKDINVFNHRSSLCL